eukprot:4754070-Pyramimonas_sp.AAC.1
MEYVSYTSERPVARLACAVQARVPFRKDLTRAALTSGRLSLSGVTPRHDSPPWSRTCTCRRILPS